MKKLLFASAALAAFIGTSAFAADMAAPVYKAPPPAAPVWSWTGSISEPMSVARGPIIPRSR